MRALLPRPLDRRLRPRDLLDVPLDPTQLRAAQLPPGGAMLVLGEAGHGKTTVALARLAHLYAHARGRFRAVMIVPHEGLVRLLQPALVHMGVDVFVRTYGRWARSLARRAFGDLPRREGRSTSHAVARIKRDPALFPVLSEHARLPPGIVDDDRDAPPPRTLAHAHRGDLQHLFGDRLLVERVAGASSRRVSRHAVDAILEHTRVQFLQRTERAHAHVDREKLVTSDGLSLDAGTPTEDAASIDVEDYAVLFELDRLRAAHRGLPATPTRRYDCIVLDEAQELAPIELALIGRCLAPEGTLVVAGDADQQIDETTCFAGWNATMRALGFEAYERVLLEIGYRCAPETMRLARAIRDGDPIDDDPILRFDDEPALARWLIEELDALLDDDPTASICIVARRPATAKRIAAALKGKVPRRLALDGEAMQHKGVVVTTVDQVQGLEYDFVVVPDATADDYPDDPRSRRAMYVALTRARHQAVLTAARGSTPLASAAARATPSPRGR